MGATASNAKNAGGRELVGQRAIHWTGLLLQSHPLCRILFLVEGENRAGREPERSGHQGREHRKRSSARFAARPETKDGEVVEPSGIEPLTSTMPL